LPKKTLVALEAEDIGYVVQVKPNQNTLYEALSITLDGISRAESIENAKVNRAIRKEIGAKINDIKWEKSYQERLLQNEAVAKNPLESSAKRNRAVIKISDIKKSRVIKENKTGKILGDLPKLEQEKQVLETSLIKPRSKPLRKAKAVHVKKESKKGCEFTWEINVYDASSVLSGFKLKSEYIGVKTIIRIHRKCIHKNKDLVRQDYDSVSYYISNCTGISAEEWASRIRQHWQIESAVHYSKDVYFNEDKNKIVNKNGASALSVLISTAINILSTLGAKSLPLAIKQFTFNFKDLFINRATHK
jgi:predicted transposase YbfD/YdcC